MGEVGILLMVGALLVAIFYKKTTLEVEQTGQKFWADQVREEENRKNRYSDHSLNFYKEQLNEEKAKYNKLKKKISTEKTLIAGGLCVLGLVCIIIGFSDMKSTKKVSKEEEEWVIENFGDGQYQDIQDAIEEYQHHH